MQAITLPIARQMAGHLSGDHSLDVLEVGCGDRPLTPLVRSNTWTGIDINLDSLSRTDPALRRCAADMTVLPFRDECFDAILSFSTLQYVDYEAAFAEFARVLRPRGTLLLGENLAFNPIARAFRLVTAFRATARGGSAVTRTYLDPANSTVLSSHFDSISAEPFYLFTPLLFAISPQPAGSPKALLGHLAADGLSRLDTAMMGPTLKRFPWMSLVVARRGGYDAPEARSS